MKRTKFYFTKLVIIVWVMFIIAWLILIIMAHREIDLTIPFSIPFNVALISTILIVSGSIIFFRRFVCFTYDLEKKICILKEEYNMEDDSDISELNMILDSFQYLLKRDAMLTVAHKQAELEALQSQINPHFLYNTLETIRGQALVSGSKETAELTKALADIFRYNISRTGNIISLSDELENLKSYMKIQNTRFDNRFKVNITLEPELEKKKVPKLLLQPIVENCIKYGLEPKPEGGTIDIEIFETFNTVYIMIKDDGNGMSIEKLVELNNRLKKSSKNIESNQGTHIGLVNINDRIKMIYGEEYGLNVESAPMIGTLVTVRIASKDVIN